MKVSSDAMVLGAMAPVEGCQRILDVGCGTGILALMLAQRAAANASVPRLTIDAVEIDPVAADAAKANVASSPFADMIHVRATSLQAWAVISRERYDLIVCNPPFFHNYLRAEDRSRSLARHSSPGGLTWNTLLSCAMALLAERGQLWVLLAAEEQTALAMAAASTQTLRPIVRTAIAHSPAHAAKRVICGFVRELSPREGGEGAHPGIVVPTAVLCRHDSGGRVTPEMHALLKDFMLYY